MKPSFEDFIQQQVPIEPQNPIIEPIKIPFTEFLKQQGALESEQIPPLPQKPSFKDFLWEQGAKEPPGIIERSKLDVPGIALETVKETGKDIGKWGLGAVEAGVSLVRGMTGFMLGTAGKILGWTAGANKYVDDLRNLKKPTMNRESILNFGQTIQDATNKVMNYTPTTEEGRFMVEVASSPFALLDLASKYTVDQWTNLLYPPQGPAGFKGAEPVPGEIGPPSPAVMAARAEVRTQEDKIRATKSLMTGLIDTAIIMALPKIQHKFRAWIEDRIITGKPIKSQLLRDILGEDEGLTPQERQTFAQAFDSLEKKWGEQEYRFGKERAKREEFFKENEEIFAGEPFVKIPGEAPILKPTMPAPIETKYSNPIFQDISDRHGKVRPSESYPNSVLKEVLPPGLIGAKDSKFGTIDEVAMDIMNGKYAGDAAALLVDLEREKRYRSNKATEPKLSANEQAEMMKDELEWTKQKDEERTAAEAEKIMMMEPPTGEPPIGREPGFDDMVETAYAEISGEKKLEKQAGFISIGLGKKTPGPQLPTPVQEVLKYSLLPTDIKGRINFKFHELADAFNRVFGFETKIAKEYPEYRNILRKFSDMPSDKIELSIKAVVSTLGKGIIKNHRQYKIFNDYIALKSIEGDLKQGLKVSGDLTLPQVQTGLAELQRFIDLEPNIKEAIKMHNALVTEIGNDLIKRGKLEEDTLRSDYFPHRVLDYTPIWADWKGMPKRMAKPFRGYIKPRRGTVRNVDFDYASAMSDYYAKVKMDNALDDFVVETATKYDATPSLMKLPEVQRKAILLGRDTPAPKGIYTINGKEYKGFQFDRGNILYKAKSINESLWEQAIIEGWSAMEFEMAVGKRGGASMKDILALGPKKHVALLPAAIAEKMERFRLPAGDLPFFWDLRDFMSLWKRMTLDVAGIPFQLNNMIGDLINLYKTDVGAFRNLPSAAKLIWKEMRSPKKLTQSELDFMKLAQEQRVTQTLFQKEKGAIEADIRDLRRLRHDLPVNLPRPIKAYEMISGAREEIARLAKFKTDVERIERGLPIVSKEIDVRGLKQIDAAGKTARSFTVDYGEISPAYRRYWRGVLFPFLTFYDHNARNWFNYVTKYPGEAALKFGIPLAGMFAWNNTGDRKEIEKNLGYWRYFPHIITGYNTKDGKPIIVAFQSPIEMAAGVLGLDRLPANIEDVIYKKKTIKEAALKQLGDTILGTPRMAGKLLNPFVSAIIGLARNKDLQTNQTIVPPEFENTPYEKNYKAEYLLSHIITPAGQYMRLRNEIELSPRFGSFGAWLLKGPLDILRGFGIRTVDMDKALTREGYQIEKELTDEVRSKLAVIRVDWIRANSAPKEEGEKIWTQAQDRVLGMKGGMPTGEQIMNVIESTDVNLQILTNLIKSEKDETVREDLKDLHKTMLNQRFTKDMLKTWKAIRPELWKRLLDLFPQK